MGASILSIVRELHPPARRFLYFSFFNVISWQCIVGPAMILFGRKIGMPASWIGFLQSFLPLSMLLVMFTVPLVEKLGPRNVMLKGWLMRNLIVSAVFLMPLAMMTWGERSAWYVLMGATLGFCIMRAVAVGGWFPWLHEVVSEEQRGQFFSAEATVVQAVNVVIVLTQSVVLSGNPGMFRFLAIYVVGIGFGLFSLYYMSRIPGGNAPDTVHPENWGFRPYRVVMADRTYLGFIVIATLTYCSISWCGSAIVLYLRDALGFSSMTVMAVMAAGSMGIFFTIRFWGRFADDSGSGIAMALTLVGHSLSTVAFLLAVPGAAWTPWCIAPLVAIVSLFNAACWMAGHRAMLHFVQEVGRVAYTNLWIFGTSIALGITPIIVGYVIEHWGMAGFQFCFVFSAATGLACALACRVFVRDGAPFSRPARYLLNPGLPVRTLARIAWITAGRHPSNRKKAA